MTVEFRDLKTLAEQDIGLSLSEALALRRLQYEDVIPEEILDLLEEAAETYATLAPVLSDQLRKIARKEIDFFISLYQNKIRQHYYTQNPQPPQKILQLLSCCVS
jgi:hypothetical protein